MIETLNGGEVREATLKRIITNSLTKTVSCDLAANIVADFNNNLWEVVVVEEEVAEQGQKRYPELCLPYDLEEASRERAECMAEEGIKPPKGWTLEEVAKMGFLHAANTQLAYEDEGMYVDQDEAIKDVLKNAKKYEGSVVGN